MAATLQKKPKSPPLHYWVVSSYEVFVSICCVWPYDGLATCPECILVFYLWTLSRKKEVKKMNGRMQCWFSPKGHCSLWPIFSNYKIPFGLFRSSSANLRCAATLFWEEAHSNLTTFFFFQSDLRVNLLQGRLPNVLNIFQLWVISLNVELEAPI